MGRAKRYRGYIRNRNKWSQRNNPIQVVVVPESPYFPRSRQRNVSLERNAATRKPLSSEFFFFPAVSRPSARGTDASNEVSARLVIEVVADVPARHRPCNKCTTKTSFVSEHCLTARRAAGKRWKTIRLVGRFSSGRVPAAVALMPFLYQPKWRSTASLSLYREYMKRKERTRQTERDRDRGRGEKERHESCRQDAATQF